MNFSGISSKKYLGRVMRLPLKLIPPQMRLPILQGRLKGKKWIAGAHTHGCWLGSYEYEKQNLFEERIALGSVVFDIGANVGFYTLLASELVGPQGHVYAFEPVPRNLGYLNRHLQLNNVNNATVIEAAVSDRTGTAFFDNSVGSAAGRIDSRGGIAVNTVKLDELIGSGKLSHPSYIKIDVEGAEFSVLSGAQSMLTNARPTIFLATHGEAVHQQCCLLLASMGYALEPIGASAIEQADELIASPKS